MNETATILVVDDTPQNLGLLFEVLGAAGFEVLVVESGEVALERMDVMSPDLILLDVRLPGADGIQICRMLKAMPLYSDIPVIMLTALHETADTIAGFSVGAVDYLSKPVEPEEVLARVRTHLQIRRLHKTLEARNRALSSEIRRRRAAERQIEQSLDLGVMVVSESGKVEFATKRAWDLLSRFYADLKFGLPAEILHWLTNGHRTQLACRCSNGELIIRAQSKTQPGESWLLRLEENIEIHSSEILERLGLTPREAEVLYWLARGKSSPEISTILQTALSTVKKHAQNIYQKLNVENRTAAAMRALELLQKSDPPTGG